MRLALLAAAALMMAGQAAAQSSAPPAREAKGFATIKADTIRKDLTYVASDELEGRLSLTPGDEKAIAWIADQFAQAGLKPAAVGPDGKPSYLQPIRMVEFRNDPAASGTTLTRGGKTTVWRAPDVAGGFKNDIDVSGGVVFAGFGITAPELGYDDYAGLDVRGKIVLIFDHEPQETDAHSIFNGVGLTRYATARVKVLNAQRHGAVAVLIVPEPNRKHFTNAQRGQAMGRAVTPRYAPLASQAIENDEVTIPSLNLREPVAAELLASSGMTPSQIQSAIDADLKPHSMVLPDTNLAIRLRNTSRRLGVTHNVVALLPGSDPKLAAETILISGHHDHDGMEQCKDPANPPVTVPPDPKPCPRIWNGADDNGSGTVGVVTLARAFGANPARPKRSILFAVFASEERGLLGSYYLAAHPLRPLASTKAMINFDMIGRDEIPSPQTDGVIDIPADTTNRLNLIGALYSPDYDRTVKETNKAIGLTLDDRFDRDSALNVFFRSDQFPFVLHDIPAFWWFTGFHPDYHHTTDTVDKIDFPKMEKILKLAYLTAWRFGDEATTPRFVANPKVN